MVKKDRRLFRSLCVILLAVAGTAGVSFSADEATHALYFSAWAAGKPQSPGDASCFTDSWGSVENNCTTAKTWVMSVSADEELDASAETDTEQQILVGAASNSGSCFMVAANYLSYPGDGTGVYFGSNVDLSTTQTLIGDWPAGSAPAAFSVYCSIPQNAKVGPIQVFN